MYFAFLGTLSCRRVDTGGVVEFAALTRTQLQKYQDRDRARHDSNTVRCVSLSPEHFVSELKKPELEDRGLLNALADATIEDHGLRCCSACALDLPLNRFHNGARARDACLCLGTRFDKLDAGPMTAQQ